MEEGTLFKLLTSTAAVSLSSLEFNLPSAITVEHDSLLGSLVSQNMKTVARKYRKISNIVDSVGGLVEEPLYPD